MLRGATKEAGVVTGIIDDDIDALEADNEGWVELPRVEVLLKIERMLTQDLVAFEIEYATDLTPIGNVESHTWFLMDVSGEQLPAFLVLRDPARTDVRWFVHVDLTQD